MPLAQLPPLQHWPCAATARRGKEALGLSDIEALAVLDGLLRGMLGKLTLRQGVVVIQFKER